MEFVAVNAELLRPVGYVGGHFGVDLLGVVRAFGGFFVDSVRFVRFWGFVVLGQGVSFRGQPPVRCGMLG